MKELSLQEIKQIEFALLRKFDVFCKENQIRYFLSNGTLLGAIKYNGFIPWDDDIDVLVPRMDYDRLLSLFKDDERYKLFAFEKEPKYRFPFAKLCDLTTKKEEENIDNGVSLGVDIDIFPLDSWACDLHRARREAVQIQKKMFYLGLTKLCQADSATPIKRAVKKTVMLFCKIIGSKHFIRSIIKDCVNTAQKDSHYCGCKSWCIYGEREIIPAEAFSDTTYVEFEGEMFPAPSGWDTYLTCLYGDYLPEPPKEKQKTHHVFRAYRL